MSSQVNGRNASISDLSGKALSTNIRDRSTITRDRAGQQQYTTAARRYTQPHDGETRRTAGRRLQCESLWGVHWGWSARSPGSNRSCGVVILPSEKRLPQTSCGKIYIPRNNIWGRGGAIRLATQHSDLLLICLYVPQKQAAESRMLPGIARLNKRSFDGPRRSSMKPHTAHFPYWDWT